MRLFRQAAAAILLGLLLVPAAMACLVPEAQMSAAEHACCKMMAHQCGGMNQSADHPCCRKEVRLTNVFVTSQGRALTASAISYVPVATAAALGLSSLAHETAIDSSHSPPGYPKQTTILRI